MQINVHNYKVSQSLRNSAGGKTDKALLQAEMKAWLEATIADDNADFAVVVCDEYSEFGQLKAENQQGAGPVKIHGHTSCMGNLSQEGLALSGANNPILSLMTIKDKEGSYGVAIKDYDGASSAQAQNAGAQALLEALEDAGRTGEVPHMIMICATPGQEEYVIKGIKSVVGTAAPIVGGTAADNMIKGNWRIFTADKQSQSGVLVSVLFSSTPVESAFHSGYTPTGSHGIVTKAKGRKIFTIDGKPASHVYNAWSNQALSKALKNFEQDPQCTSESILHISNIYPLGRYLADNDDSLLLAHPETVYADGSISLFAEVQEGTEIHCLTGTLDNLTSRAGRVIRSAQDSIPEGYEVAGCILVYCAGCMLAVRTKMSDVVYAVRQELDDLPFLGMFTFGEQGCLRDSDSLHGNLMISALLFTRKKNSDKQAGK